jgi:hypothetical protein
MASYGERLRLGQNCSAKGDGDEKVKVGRLVGRIRQGFHARRRPTRGRVGSMIQIKRLEQSPS